MGAMTTKLGPFYLWQTLVLVVAFVVAGGGVYGGLALADDSGGSGLSDDETLVFAQLGDLTNLVSTDGSLTFPEVETARFEAAGVVGNVLMTEGDTVEAGQPLAMLDDASTVALEMKVARASVTLREAEDALADATQPADPSAQAKAESAVAKAELALRTAREGLATATAGVDSLELAESESNVAKAELALQAANEALADLSSGASAEEQTDAQAAVDAARTELANSEANLALTTRDRNERIDTAVADKDAAVAAYEGSFDLWLGVDAALLDTTLDPAALTTSLGIDLTTLFDPANTEIPNLALRVSPPSNDPATAWDESTIYSWIAFFPGEVVATCDDGAPFQGLCVQQELDDAWDALKSARNTLETVELDAAKAIASSQSAVAKAEDTLEAVQTALADLLADADPLALDAANADVAVAQANLDDAKAELADAAGGSDPLAVEVAKAELAIAQAGLDDANAALAELAAGTDDRDIALLTTELAAAELALEQAATDLAGATLVAPIAGVVTDVALESGQNAAAQQASITIVDESVVELEGTVDEIDVLSIGEGVEASVALSALPGQALRGTVTEIGAPTNQQGVVTFPVSIRLEVPDGLQLLEGLSATASIVVSQELNVLRVPTAAVQGSFVQPFVRVLNGNGVEERLVELGSSDDFWVVVTAGLVVGEQVAMPAPSSGDTGFANFAFGAGGGGAALRALQGGAVRRGGGGGQGGAGQGGGGNR